MIETALAKYLRDNVPLVNNNVNFALSNDDVPDEQIVFSVDPIGQENFSGGGSIGHVDILTIDVYAKKEKYAEAVNVTEEVDIALEGLCNASLDNYVMHTSPRARWRFVQLARSEQIIFQRQYWFNSK